MIIQERISKSKKRKSKKEEIFERRFVNIVKKIINLNKVRKVFEDFAREKRQIEMADEFKMMLPIFDTAQTIARGRRELQHF